MSLFKDMTKEDWQGLIKLVLTFAFIGFTAWAVIDDRVVPAVVGVGSAIVDLVVSGIGAATGGS